MPTHQSAASAINLIDEENEQAPRPVEAEALPGNAMDDAVMRVIARVEQTFGAWRLSAADQDRHVSADRLQLAAQHDRWRAAEQARHVRADRLRLAARRDRWSAAEREGRRAAQQERIHRRLPAVDTVSQLGTRLVSTPIPRQEWAEALSAVLAPDVGHAVLAPDARRAVRMGVAVRLVCGPLDANALVRRLDRLLGPGVHLGAVEEHGHCILELVIFDEIPNLELEIALQMYRERVDCLDERLHEFRQSQELP